MNNYIIIITLINDNEYLTICISWIREKCEFYLQHESESALHYLIWIYEQINYLNVIRL